LRAEVVKSASRAGVEDFTEENEGTGPLKRESVKREAGHGAAGTVKVRVRMVDWVWRVGADGFSPWAMVWRRPSGPGTVVDLPPRSGLGVVQPARRRTRRFSMRMLGFIFLRWLLFGGGGELFAMPLFWWVVRLPNWVA
jgi:hypothetical protein